MTPKEKKAAYMRKWYASNKAKTHGYQLKRKFDITVEVYQEMFEKQDGVCAICKESCLSGFRLAVDHCHATGAIRALLCMNCNQALGKMRDDPALLRAAAEYLEEHATG